MSFVETNFCENSDRDVEIGPATEFETYINEIIRTKKIDNEIYRKYGVSSTGQHFVLLLCCNWCDMVYTISEPLRDKDGNYLKFHSFIVSSKFNNEHEAMEYIKCMHYDLQVENALDCHMSERFEKSIIGRLHFVRGSEIYRIRVIDADENISTDSDINVLCAGNRKEVDAFIQKQRNKLKGISVPIELRKTGTELDKTIKLDKTFSEEKFTKTVLDRGFRQVLEEAPQFIAFVEESVNRAFRGEESYRMFGITEAGQRFAFVVSKV